jgi:hypothetical protein
VPCSQVPLVSNWLQEAFDGIMSSALVRPNQLVFDFGTCTGLVACRRNAWGEEERGRWP